jgi:homoserine kinase
MSQFIQQSSHLAAFIAACFKQDNELLRRSCKDFVIENQRSHLINGFQDVQMAAINAGALACSISGSGPSVFAFAENAKSAEKIKIHMEQAFKSNGILKIESWIAPISNSGAKLI